MIKITYFIGLLSSVALSVGLTFKLLHWPGADELIIYGFLTFSLLFVPASTVIHRKTTMKASLAEKSKAGLGLASACIAGISVVFKMMHLQGADLLLLTSAMLFSFGFLPVLFFTLYKKSD